MPSASGSLGVRTLTEAGAFTKGRTGTPFAGAPPVLMLTEYSTLLTVRYIPLSQLETKSESCLVSEMRW